VLHAELERGLLPLTARLGRRGAAAQGNSCSCCRWERALLLLNATAGAAAAAGDGRSCRRCGCRRSCCCWRQGQGAVLCQQSSTYPSLITHMSLSQCHHCHNKRKAFVFDSSPRVTGHMSQVTCHKKPTLSSVFNLKQYRKDVFFRRGKFRLGRFFVERLSKPIFFGKW
jgi:hypothetical protein